MKNIFEIPFDNDSLENYFPLFAPRSTPFTQLA